MSISASRSGRKNTSPTLTEERSRPFSRIASFLVRRMRMAWCDFVRKKSATRILAFAQAKIHRADIRLSCLASVSGPSVQTLRASSARHDPRLVRSVEDPQLGHLRLLGRTADEHEPAIRHDVPTD